MRRILGGGRDRLMIWNLRMYSRSTGTSIFHRNNKRIQKTLQTWKYSHCKEALWKARGPVATGYWETFLLAWMSMVLSSLKVSGAMRVTTVLITPVLIFFATFSFHGRLPSARCASVANTISCSSYFLEVLFSFTICYM